MSGFSVLIPLATLRPNQSMQAESEAKRMIKEVINTISAEANRPVNLIRRRRQSNHLAVGSRQRVIEFSVDSIQAKQIRCSNRCLAAVLMSDL